MVFGLRENLHHILMVPIVKCNEFNEISRNFLNNEYNVFISDSIQFIPSFFVFFVSKSFSFCQATAVNKNTGLNLS